MKPVEELKLNAQATWIRLSSAVTLGAILFGAYSSWHTHLQHADALEERLDRLERQALPIPLGDRWTCLDQERWLVRLRESNLELKVPALPKVCAP